MGTPWALDPRAEVLRPLLVGLASAVVLCLPAWLAGGLVGSPGGETLGHAWVQSWATSAWPAWPVGTDLAAGAASWPVIDPLPTWIVAGSARVVGLTAAWNGLVAAGIVVAALGGARLARAAGGSATFGALAVPWMPIYLGSLTSGLTEDAFLGLVAFALAAALEGTWVRAGLLVGLASGCGLYLGWMAAVGVAAVGVRAGVRGELARSWRGMAAGAAVAAALSLLAAAPFSGRLGGAAVTRPAPPVHEAHWALNPWRGADLASFVAPGEVVLGDAVVREHPTYLGFTTLGLAALGGTPAGWAAVAACVLVAPGEDLAFAGKPLGIRNPAIAVLHVVPFGDRFRNHARLMLLGQLVLVAMASRGVARLDRWGAGFTASAFTASAFTASAFTASAFTASAFTASAFTASAVPVVAALVVAGETAWASPARVPLPVTPSASPAIYASLSTAPPGLPVRVIGAHNPQQPLYDQRAHGRRLMNGPNQPDPGRPRAEAEIVVAFGEATTRLTAELGTPDAVADGAMAWWPGPTGTPERQP